MARKKRQKWAELKPSLYISTCKEFEIIKICLKNEKKKYNTAFFKQLSSLSPLYIYFFILF